jgi:hypothetical protein
VCVKCLDVIPKGGKAALSFRGEALAHVDGFADVKHAALWSGEHLALGSDVAEG